MLAYHREIIRALDAVGAQNPRIDFKKRKHPRATFEINGRTCSRVIAGTPSDVRALQNMVADAKRMIGPVAEEPPRQKRTLEEMTATLVNAAAPDGDIWRRVHGPVMPAPSKTHRGTMQLHPHGRKPGDLRLRFFLPDALVADLGYEAGTPVQLKQHDANMWEIGVAEAGWRRDRGRPPTLHKERLGSGRKEAWVVQFSCRGLDGLALATGTYPTDCLVEDGKIVIEALTNERRERGHAIRPKLVRTEPFEIAEEAAVDFLNRPNFQSTPTPEPAPTAEVIKLPRVDELKGFEAMREALRAIERVERNTPFRLHLVLDGWRWFYEGPREIGLEAEAA